MFTPVPFKKTGIAQTVVSILTLISIIMLFTLFAPCPNKEMPCNKTTAVAIPLYAGMLICSCFASYFRASKHLYNGLTIFTLLFNLSASLTPVLLHGCMKTDMRCHTLTFPYIRVTFFVLLILQLACVFIRRKEAGMTGGSEA